MNVFEELSKKVIEIMEKHGYSAFLEKAFWQDPDERTTPCIVVEGSGDVDNIKLKICFYPSGQIVVEDTDYWIGPKYLDEHSFIWDNVKEMIEDLEEKLYETWDKVREERNKLLRRWGIKR